MAVQARVIILYFFTVVYRRSQNWNSHILRIRENVHYTTAKF